MYPKKEVDHVPSSPREVPLGWTECQKLTGGRFHARFPRPRSRNSSPPTSLSNFHAHSHLRASAPSFFQVGFPPAPPLQPFQVVAPLVKGHPAGRHLLRSELLNKVDRDLMARGVVMCGLGLQALKALGSRPAKAEPSRARLEGLRLEGRAFDPRSPSPALKPGLLWGSIASGTVP